MSARSLLIKQLPCLACEIGGITRQCGPTEEHHLNLGGKAGQKRRGDAYSIPLGAWHHRGSVAMGMSVKTMAVLFGPSLFHHSRRFRDRYGTDDQLLALTNERLQVMA